MKVVSGQYAIEVAILVAVTVASLLWPRSAATSPRPGWRGFRGLRRRPLTTALLSIAIPTLAAAATSWFLRWPLPITHDEFAYLLAGDTFAHGRLANPTHPFWIHFESFHVIHQPSYASKYPPGQGLFLALGQVLTGAPLAGVWLSCGLFAGAVHWMLRGFVPQRWATCGWFLVTLRFAVIGPWAQSYWGGAVAGLGGALVIGAAARLLRRRRTVDGAWLGLGMVLLAVSRPFEGLAATLPVFVVSGLALRHRRSSSMPVGGRPTLAAVLVLACGATFILCQNHAVTGHALRMPYMVHDAAYAVAPPLLFLPVAPTPEYRHDVIKRFWTEFAREPHVRQRTLVGWWRAARDKTLKVWRFYLGTFLFLPLLFIWRRRSTRRLPLWPLAVCAVVHGALLAETYDLPHYAAPATGALWVAVMIGLRELARRRVAGRQVGLALVRAVILSQIVLTAVALWHWGNAGAGWGDTRAALIRDLQADAGRHLVLVRYDAGHNAHFEWVYNGAELDAQQVLFARAMDDDADRRLIAAMPDRRPWLLDVDSPATRPDLRPYPLH